MNLASSISLQGCSTAVVGLRQRSCVVSRPARCLGPSAALPASRRGGSHLSARPRTALKAEQKQEGSKPTDGQERSEQERRLEALEASIRGKAGPAPIKIRNSAQEEKEREESSSPYAPWPEGQLLPLGWENMNGYQKTVELLYGRRGFLFWLNKIAYTSVFVLIGAWILFRFVGPGLGLYTLEGNFAPPPI